MSVKFFSIFTLFFVISCSTTVNRAPANLVDIDSCKASIKSFFKDFKDKRITGLHDSQILKTKLIPLSKREELSIEIELKTASIRRDITDDLPKTGTTNPHLLELVGGIKAVWKPHQKVKLSNYRAEVLAYELDQILDLKLVPPTVERVINDEHGSLQLFEEAISGPLLIFNKNQKMTKEAIERVDHELRKQSFFDYLIQNGDRHKGNFLFTLDGRVISIDNGSSFTGHGFNMKSFEVRKSDIQSFIQTDEGKKVLKKLRSINNDKFKEEIEGYLGKSDTLTFFDRIEVILNLKK